MKKSYVNLRASKIQDLTQPWSKRNLIEIRRMNLSLLEIDRHSKEQE